MNIILALLIMTPIHSCKNMNSKYSYLSNCFTKVEQSRIEELLTSFDRFITKNFNGKVEGIIEDLGQTPIDSFRNFKFSQSDSNLYTRLQKNEFIKLAYSTDYIRNHIHKYPKSQQSKILSQNPNKLLIELNFESKYYNCLASMSDKNDWLKEYIKTLDLVRNMSFNVLSNKLAKGLNENTKNLNIIKFILSIEVYYFILELKYQKTI